VAVVMVVLMVVVSVVWWGGEGQKEANVNYASLINEKERLMFYN